MDHQPKRQFPWTELLLTLVLGVPALAIALLCCLFVWTYSGPQFDTVCINDHPIGGTFDKVVAAIIGTVAGAAVVFLIARFRSHL